MQQTSTRGGRIRLIVPKIRLTVPKIRLTVPKMRSTRRHSTPKVSYHHFLGPDVLKYRGFGKFGTIRRLRIFLKAECFHINEPKLCTHSSVHLFFETNISLYRVFIKYCLSLLSLGVSVRTHTRHVKHQRCSRTGRVQKNQNKILRKKQYI